METRLLGRTGRTAGSIVDPDQHCLTVQLAFAIEAEILVEDGPVRLCSAPRSLYPASSSAISDRSRIESRSSYALPGDASGGVGRARQITAERRYSSLDSSREEGDSGRGWWTSSNGGPSRLIVGLMSRRRARRSRAGRRSRPRQSLRSPRAHSFEPRRSAPGPGRSATVRVRGHCPNLARRLT